MKDTIIRLIRLAGLGSEEQGVCHGSAVLALQAFILGTEYQQNYIERLEKMAQLNLEPDDVLKHKLESRDEKGVLKYSDILAHLQTVKLFHSPDEYLDWFDSLTVLRQSDVAAVASIAQSQLAEKRGGIHQVSSFSAVYKYTEMDVYLTSLQKVMETPLHKETRCGLLLSSPRHLIMLGYDAANSVFPWTIDDAATVTQFSSDQYVEVAKKIRKIFTNDTANDKPLILCTAVYSIGDQLEKAKLLIDSWHARCEKIHQVTAEKAKVIGQGGGAWLFRAAESGHTQTVELLLKKGADVNMATSDGRTPLFIAAGSGHTETVKLLLEKEVNIKAKTSDGLTALHVAVEGGYTAIVKLLLAAGADANATANDGLTALHCAVDGGGYPAIFKLLLEAGADVDAVTDGGHTPRGIAGDECLAIIKSFEKKGDINKVQVENNSAYVLVLLQRLFSFFVAASMVVLGITLSFYSLSSTPLLLAIAFTTAIVTAITVKYIPRFVEQAYTFIVGSGQENKKTSAKLYEPTACGLLTSPLDSQVSTEKTQQREAICFTNLEQSNYNRLSR
ncbi:ankyrin repeat domain-containing protein [Rickettsiella endosymbiont of Dermanyssus gallinae]|uniref:ankyrin repeat domain-containing protein n=1 Tax=Rickettsiella endosymbiont of Dermanyssus gallinae TaxID=2856608 RepID=UPI001C52A8FA|nr:ankyrin repeat domain-containing protein [Rickettsiella endosymbiont of Dermanyssus gallinae]